jgi:hypothetical protein
MKDIVETARAPLTVRGVILIGVENLRQNLEKPKHVRMIAGIISELRLAAKFYDPRSIKTCEMPAQGRLRYADFSGEAVYVLFMVRQENANL